MKTDQHEHLLYNEIDRLEKEGWRILNVGRGIPDAIAISPDMTKVMAIEILSRTKRFDSKGRSKGYRWDGKMVEKRWRYGSYDDILFVLFTRGEFVGVQKRVLASEEWPDFWEYREKTRME